MTDKPVFDAARSIKGAPLTSSDVDMLKRALASMSEKSDTLTVRVLLELIDHEAIVREAYKDSVGVWTWAVGLTAASGIDVMRYKDKPASIEECLTATVNRIRKVYLPDVLKAFAGHALSEAELAAALSFHYNTGAILRTSWIPMFRAGRRAEARNFLERHYLNGGSLTARREREAALFFDGQWEPQGGFATVYPVSKPSYQPAWSKAQRVDIRGDLERVLAA